MTQQEDNTAVRIGPLQQITDRRIREAVVRILHLGALAEQGVGLIEKKDGRCPSGILEHAVEVLFRLANGLADDLGEVDAIEIFA